MAARTQSKLSNRVKKLCPRCGQPGSGPHARWVRNSRHKRYEPYLYFAHRQGKKLTWCYLGKAEPTKELDNISVGFQRPTIRLDNKAKEYLHFLAENNIDGSFTQDKEQINSIADCLTSRNNIEHCYPRQSNISGDFCRKGLSIINYFRVTKKAVVRDYDYGCGGTEVEPRAVLHSFERTVKTLRLKGLVDRFKQDRQFHYFITVYGLEILKAKPELDNLDGAEP